MKVMIWHTPAGIIDDGGKALEGYINFNITLMAPPENDHMAVSCSETATPLTLGGLLLKACCACHHNVSVVLWHGGASAACYWDTRPQGY